MSPDFTTRADPPTPIIGECPRCRLPIYHTDDRDELEAPDGQGVRVYHAVCAWREKVWQECERANAAVNALRVLGCTVSFEITIPVPKAAA